MPKLLWGVGAVEHLAALEPDISLRRPTTELKGELILDSRLTGGKRTSN